MAYAPRLLVPGKWDGVPVVPRAVDWRLTEGLWTDRAHWMRKHGPRAVRLALHPDRVIGGLVQARIDLGHPVIAGGSMDVAGTNDGLRFTSPHQNLNASWSGHIILDSESGNPRFMFHGDNSSTGEYLMRETVLSGTPSDYRIEGNGATTGFYSEDTSGGFDASVWHHCAHVDASGSSHFGYLDGTVTAEDTTTIDASANTDVLSYGNLDDGSGPRLGINGRMCECVMWEAYTLSAAEVSAISSGYPAALIAPHAIVSYVPMLRGTPWRDVWRALDATVLSTVDVGDHRAVMIPGAQQRVGIPTAAAAGGISPAVALYHQRHHNRAA